MGGYQKKRKKSEETIPLLLKPIKENKHGVKYCLINYEEAIALVNRIKRAKKIVCLRKQQR